MAKEKWIGVEIPTSNGIYKICIGLNTENGNEVSFCNEEDIKLAKKHNESPWISKGNIVVKKGHAFVFDKKHNLIKK
jgi:hypothetical protein